MIYSHTLPFMSEKLLLFFICIASHVAFGCCNSYTYDVLCYLIGRGEICIRVNLSTGQWVYLYTFFSNFRVQNRGEICIHKRSKQEWNLYTKVEGKGCICILYFINLKDFFRVKAKVTFVYFCQISDEICILLVNRELVLWDEPNVRLV